MYGIHYLICFIQCLTVYNVLLLTALVNVTGRLVFSFLYTLSALLEYVIIMFAFLYALGVKK